MSFIRLVVTLIGLCITLFTSLIAQGDFSVNQSVKLIARGLEEEARAAVSRLQHQRSPDLYYVRGLMATDGRVALQYFSVVVDSFAVSEWADDALARILEYQERTGDRRAAHLSLTQLRSQYPASPYIKKAYFRDAAYLPGDSSPVAMREKV